MLVLRGTSRLRLSMILSVFFSAVLAAWAAPALAVTFVFEVPTASINDGDVFSAATQAGINVTAESDPSGSFPVNCTAYVNHNDVDTVQLYNLRSDNRLNITVSVPQDEPTYNTTFNNTQVKSVERVHNATSVLAQSEYSGNSTHIVFSLSSGALSGVNYNVSVLINENVSWSNATVVSFNDTEFEDPHDLSFRCSDVNGEVTWGNSTPNDLVEFRVDSTDPIAVAPTISVSNSTETDESATGNTVTATFTVLDENAQTCGISYVNGNTEVTSNFSGSFSGNGSSSTCTVSFTPGNFGTDGNFTVTGTFVTDAAENSVTNSTSATKQYVVQRLEAGQWNMVRYSGLNRTMLDIAKAAPNVTAIAFYDNRPGQKSYTQWDLGSSDNEGVQINVTNATIMFVDADSKDVWMVMNFTAEVLGSPNLQFPLYSISASVKGLNQVPILGNVTMNQTLYSCRSVGQVAFDNTNGRNCNDTYQNVTSVRWWDAGNQRYCSAAKGSITTSCRDFTVGNLTFQNGDAVWVDTKFLNMTLNMTELFGGRIA